MVDGIATFLRKKKKRGEFEIWEGKFFNDDQKCFVANRQDFYAHGRTIKEAIEDVNFKYLNESMDVQDVVNQIKATGSMSVAEFRMITGACREGCRRFLKQRGISKTELPFNEAIELIKDQFGWGRIQEAFSP